MGGVLSQGLWVGTLNGNMGRPRNGWHLRCSNKLLPLSYTGICLFTLVPLNSGKKQL